MSCRRGTTYLIFHGLRLEKSKGLFDFFFSERKGIRSIVCGSIIGRRLSTYLISNRLKSLLVKMMSKRISMKLITLVNYVSNSTTMRASRLLFLWPRALLFFVVIRFTCCVANTMVSMFGCPVVTTFLCLSSCRMREYAQFKLGRGSISRIYPHTTKYDSFRPIKN